MILESAVPMGLTYLDLPTLPVELENSIVEFALAIPPDEDGRRWIEDFHYNKLQAVSVVFGRSNTFLPDNIQQQLNNIYSKYLNEPVKGVVGNLNNTQQYPYACSAPHCDRYRYVSFNYLLRAGGEHVITRFYKQQRGSDDLTSAANLQIDKLEFDTEFCVSERQWHSYNTQYYHSVENIQTVRLMLVLFPESNPTVSLFKQKYSGLIKNLKVAQ